MKLLRNGIFFAVAAVITTLYSCKSGPFNLIKPASPHQAYERKLINAGLNQTAMGTAWIEKAQQSLQSPLPISLPYQETGYFAADKIETAVFNFTIQRGQKLHINLTTKPVGRFKVYIDLLVLSESNEFKIIASADTLGNTLAVTIDKTGTYLLRLQPELLSSVEYTLALTTGPSLNFPIKAGNAKQIQSFWGDGRDANTRKHEGIDIFAPFRTPVIAVSAGRITTVNENNLGGKVVWFRPEGKDYTLYYAHLDEQTVDAGQVVNYGDTLGRMGNTGNAKTTAPHLHFGIYTSDGPVDPFPFVNPIYTIAPKVLEETSLLNSTMRTNAKATLQNIAPTVLNRGTVVRINASSANTYRVELPDGSHGYVPGKYLTAIKKPLETFNVRTAQINVYDQPDSIAAVKSKLKLGDRAAVLGSFGDFKLVEYGDKLIGWIKY